MHPHLRGERRWKDRGVQEDPAVLCRHLSGQRAGADRQRPPAAVQPCAGGEPPERALMPRLLIRKKSARCQPQKEG